MSPYQWVHLRAFVDMFVCLCLYPLVYLYMCVYVSLWMSVYVSVSVCVPVYQWACLCVYLRILGGPLQDPAHMLTWALSVTLPGSGGLQAHWHCATEASGLEWVLCLWLDCPHEAQDTVLSVQPQCPHWPPEKAQPGFAKVSYWDKLAEMAVIELSMDGVREVARSPPLTARDIRVAFWRAD